METTLERPVAVLDEESFDEVLEEPSNPAAACQLGTLACDTCINVGCPLLALRGDTAEQPPIAWPESEPADDTFEARNTRDMLFDDSVEVVIAQPEQPMSRSSSRDESIERTAAETVQTNSQPVAETPTVKAESTTHSSTTNDTNKLASTTPIKQSHTPTTPREPEVKVTPTTETKTPPEPNISKPESAPEPVKPQPSPVTERRDSPAEVQPVPQQTTEERQSTQVQTPVKKEPTMPPATPVETQAPPVQPSQADALKAEPQPPAPAQQRATSSEPETTPPPVIEQPAAKSSAEQETRPVEAAPVDTPTQPPVPAEAVADVAERETITPIDAEAVQSVSPIIQPEPAVEPQAPSTDEISLEATNRGASDQTEPLKQQLQIEQEPTSFTNKPTEQLDKEASIVLPEDLLQSSVTDDVPLEPQLTPPEPVATAPVDETIPLDESQLIHDVQTETKEAENNQTMFMPEPIIDDAPLTTATMASERDIEPPQERMAFDEIIERAYADTIESDTPGELDSELPPEIPLETEFIPEPASDTEQPVDLFSEAAEISPPEAGEPESTELDSEPPTNHKHDILDNLVVDLTTLEETAENTSDDETEAISFEPEMDDDASEHSTDTEVDDITRTEYSVEEILDPEQPTPAHSTHTMTELLERLLGQRACTLA